MQIAGDFDLYTNIISHEEQHATMTFNVRCQDHRANVLKSEILQTISAKELILHVNPHIQSYNCNHDLKGHRSRAYNTNMKITLSQK